MMAGFGHYLHLVEYGLVDTPSEIWVAALRVVVLCDLGGGVIANELFGFGRAGRLENAFSPFDT